MGALLKEVCGPDAKVSHDDIKVVMGELDSDDSGHITLPEFTTWYLSSEARIEKDIKEAFNQFDGDHSGALTVKEVKSTIKALNGVNVADEDVEAALSVLTKGDATAVITFQNFSSYYVNSHLAARRHSIMDEQAEASKGLPLWPPPKDGGVGGKINFFITLPLVVAMKSIPDVRRRE